MPSMNLRSSVQSLNINFAVFIFRIRFANQRSTQSDTGLKTKEKCNQIVQNVLSLLSVRAINIVHVPQLTKKASE